MNEGDDEYNTFENDITKHHNFFGRTSKYLEHYGITKTQETEPLSVFRGSSQSISGYAVAVLAVLAEMQRGDRFRCCLVDNFGSVQVYLPVFLLCVK